MKDFSPSSIVAGANFSNTTDNKCIDRLNIKSEIDGELFDRSPSFPSFLTIKAGDPAYLEQASRLRTDTMQSVADKHMDLFNNKSD